MRLRGTSIHEYLDPRLSTGSRLHKEVRLLFVKELEIAWSCGLKCNLASSSIRQKGLTVTQIQTQTHLDINNSKFDDAFLTWLGSCFFYHFQFRKLQIRYKLRKFALLSKSVKWDSIHIFNFLLVFSFIFFLFC